jgi:hypothetical protein
MHGYLAGEKFDGPLHLAPHEQPSCTDQAEQASISFFVFSASTPDVAYHRWFEEIKPQVSACIRSHLDIPDTTCKIRRWDQRENRRLNTGSIAFCTFPRDSVDMIVERSGDSPITLTLANLVDGKVATDHEGSLYLGPGKLCIDKTGTADMVLGEFVPGRGRRR